MSRALTLVLFLFAASANAAIVTINGDNVSFTYDDSSLYGEATVFGNTIFFQPTTFKAESLNGAGLVTTSESLDITIEALAPPLVMSGYQLAENGDYKIDGAGASVSSVGEITVDSQTSAFSDSVSFGAGALTTQGALTAWSAATSLSLGATAGWDTDTKVIMTLSNTLSADSQNIGVGETAFIEKKFEGSAVGITINMTPSVVPVPGAVWLFGSALGLLGWVKRKRR